MTDNKQPQYAEKDKFILRFSDPDQRAKLKASAALNRRTMNSEILYLLDLGMKKEEEQKAAQG